MWPSLVLGFENTNLPLAASASASRTIAATLGTSGSTWSSALPFMFAAGTINTGLATSRLGLIHSTRAPAMFELRWPVKNRTRSTSRILGGSFGVVPIAAQRAEISPALSFRLRGADAGNGFRCSVGLAVVSPLPSAQVYKEDTATSVWLYVL